MRGSFRFLPLALVLSFPLTVSGEETPLDRVVAVVDRDVVLESELERRAVWVQDVDRKALLDSMIDEVLMLAEARRQFLSASSSDVDRAIETIRSQNNLDEDALVAELKKQGYTLAEYREEVADQILIARLINLEAADVVGSVETRTATARSRLIQRLRRRAYIDVRLEVTR